MLLFIRCIANNECLCLNMHLKLKFYPKNRAQNSNIKNNLIIVKPILFFSFFHRYLLKIQLYKMLVNNFKLVSEKGHNLPIMKSKENNQQCLEEFGHGLIYVVFIVKLCV